MWILLNRHHHSHNRWNYCGDRRHRQWLSEVRRGHICMAIRCQVKRSEVKGKWPSYLSKDDVQLFFYLYFLGFLFLLSSLSCLFFVISFPPPFFPAPPPPGSLGDKSEIGFIAKLPDLFPPARGRNFLWAGNIGNLAIWRGQSFLSYVLSFRIHSNQALSFQYIVHHFLFQIISIGCEIYECLHTYLPIYSSKNPQNRSLRYVISLNTTREHPARGVTQHRILPSYESPPPPSQKKPPHTQLTIQPWTSSTWLAPRQSIVRAIFFFFFKKGGRSPRLTVKPSFIIPW